MMGFMSLEFFRQSPLLAFPVLALAIFMLVFFVTTLRTVLSHKDSWDAVARLPLERASEVREQEQAHE